MDLRPSSSNPGLSPVGPSIDRKALRQLADAGRAEPVDRADPVRADPEKPVDVDEDRKPEVEGRVAGPYFKNLRKRLRVEPELGARDEAWAEDFGGFLLKGDANFGKRGAAVDLKKELKGLDDDLRPMRAGGFPFADPLVMMMMAALADPLDKIPEADRGLKSWKDAPERTTTELGFSWGKVDQSTFNEKVKELEARLSDPEATEVARYRLGGGINGTYIVVLSNGAVGVWKPVERESQKKLRDQLEEDHQGSP